MAIEHSTLTDIHEPKGVASAASGTVYQSNGAGGGSWVPITATNITRINQESDFPLQDASTITLEANELYVLGAPITTAKRFIFEDGAALTSANRIVKFLTYTGAGVMFTSAYNADIYNLVFDCPNGTIFDFTGTSIQFVESVSCESCLAVGTIAKTLPGSLQMRQASLRDIMGQGFVCTGTASSMLFEEMYMSSNSASHIALDVSGMMIGSFGVLTNQFFGPAGSYAIKATVTSLFPGVGGAVISANSLTGTAMSAITGGIDSSSAGWAFRDNSGIADSRAFVDMYLTASETVTVSATSTFYPVAGTNWSTTKGSRFNPLTNGTAIYTGTRDDFFRVAGAVTVEKQGGGGDVIKARIAVNGVTLTESECLTDNSTPTSIPINALTALSTGDIVSIYVANDDSTANIIVDAAHINVSEA